LPTQLHHGLRVAKTLETSALFVEEKKVTFSRFPDQTRAPTGGDFLFCDDGQIVKAFGREKKLTTERQQPRNAWRQFLFFPFAS
jgi:hypothetical protein